MLSTLLTVATASPDPAGDEFDVRVYAITAALHLATGSDSKRVRQVLNRLLQRAPDSAGLKRAQDGLDTVEKCAGDLTCLGKALADPNPGVAKAAAFALGHAKDKRALGLLVDAIPPLCRVPESAFDPMLTIIFWIRRLGDRSATDALATLDGLIERAEDCGRAFPVARNLLGETRVTAAIVRRRD